MSGRIPREQVGRVLPGGARRSLLIYNTVFPFVFLALLPGFLRRMLRRGGFRAKFGQRLGFFSTLEVARLQEHQWTWIHSISVGETLIALKLARELKRRDPELRVLLSVTTSTGMALAEQSGADWIEPIYNPIDFAPVVRRIFGMLRLSRVILVEGEVWPNLLAACRRRGILVALVDARLSPRSESRFQRFRRFTAPVFRMLDFICVPDAADVRRWARLGVDPGRIRVTGSIKFDEPEQAESRTAGLRSLLAEIGIADDAPIMLGGSTWEPEERELGSIFLTLRRRSPDLFLIIVPRHVERTEEVERELTTLGLRVLRRSALAAPDSVGAASPSTNQGHPRVHDVLLVDTTGELRDWYALATVVFVGKSLPGVQQTGGQNPAEPALLQRPVLFGPHMENFAGIVAHLLAHGGAMQVPDTGALKTSIRRLLSDPAARAKLGTNARSALDEHLGATARAAVLLMNPPRT